MILTYVKYYTPIGCHICPTASLDLASSNLDRSNSRSIRLWRVISCQRFEIGHMLLLDTSRKPCNRSAAAPFEFTLSKYERSSQDHSGFEGWYLIYKHCMWIHHYYTVIGNHIWRVETWLTLKGQGQGHSDCEGLYVLKDPSYVTRCC